MRRRSLQAEANRRLRVAILELLRTEYPGALDVKVLRFSLDSLGWPLTAEALRAHLRYLEEKGLLKVQHRRGYGFSLSFVSLTARGWDLLDGHITEEGVDQAL
mgnify:CR=1 FL=1|jgi:repressor of nif and glnA expression